MVGSGNGTRHNSRMTRTLKQHVVTTADGVQIAIDDSRPDGDVGSDDVTLVFLHGIAQSRRAFRPLLEAPPSSLRHARLVAFDMRGHGDGAEAALSPEQLTKQALVHDVNAVLDGLQLVRPVLVPWSYGGVVVGALLAALGTDVAARLGGIVSCAAAVKTGRAGKGVYGATMLAHGKAMVSDDDDVYRSACAAFIAGSSVQALEPTLTSVLVAEMQRVSAPVRRALLSGAHDDTALWQSAAIPLGLIHGDDDAVVLPAMSDALLAVRPDAIVQRLPGVGHVPWLEASDVFGEAIAACLGTMLRHTVEEAPRG